MDPRVDMFSLEGDMGPHKPVLYGISSGMRPKCIVEIGIRNGASTYALNAGLHPDGVHHCCDITASCNRVVSSLRNGKFWLMDSNQFAQHYTQEPIDILMIDGCHEYLQVSMDFDHFFRYVRVNGIVIFHDTFPDAKKKDDPNSCWTVYQILDYIKDVAELEFVTLPYCNGLTIARRIR